MSQTAVSVDTAYSTSLANGLKVLHCFRTGEPVLSNKDLVERTGLSKASISRLTYTLALKGLLIYDVHLRRYRLAAGVLSLAYPLLAGIPLRQIARPFMKTLADYAGGSVSLGLYDRLHMVYLETCRGHEAIAFRPDIGARLPVLASAMGRAWLANAPEAIRQQVLDTLRDADPAHYKRHVSAWEHARQDFASKGYCLSFGDWQADVYAVGAPIPVTVGGDTIILNCGVPAAKMNRIQLEQELAPRLLDAIGQIRASLQGPQS